MTKDEMNKAVLADVNVAAKHSCDEIGLCEHGIDFGLECSVCVSHGGEQVIHPDHYADGEVECIDAMRQVATPEEFAGFCRLSAFKYLWRLGKKGPAARDAAKAEVYVRWLKETLEDKP